MTPIQRIVKTIEEKKLRIAGVSKVDVYQYQSRYFIFCSNGVYRFDHNGRYMDILPESFLVTIRAEKIATV